MSFFEKLLPSEGLVCVAQALNKGFKHYFYEDRGEAIAQIERLDKQGHTVYLAQATFDKAKIEDAQAHNAALPRGLSKAEWKQQKKGERTQANALQLKSFFLDIDCGADEKYQLKDKKQAADAIKRFVEETGLPFPAVTVSGNGLYAHWFMNEVVPAASWQTIARMLKKVVVAYTPELQDDASRTSDSASVLRPPGSTHRKDPKNPKQVLLIKDAPAIPFMDFSQALKKAARKKDVNVKPLATPKKNNDLNAEFYDGIEDGPTSSAHAIADKCSQIGLVRSQKGNVSEPLWYSAIGIMLHCEEGDELIQEWSSGHPDYTAAATSEKIDQWEQSGMGPTTCSHFNSVNPQACVGCPHSNKITSPIVLGRPEPVAKVVDEESGESETPKGFRRADGGGLMYEEEGRWATFYDQDLYPIRLAYDDSLGYEVMTIKHYLPHEGWMEFTMRSSAVNDPSAFLGCLFDNHVKVVGIKEKKVMQMYVESYAQKLQRKRRMAQLLCQMGWKDDTRGEAMFVLGRKIFHQNGTVEDAALARNVPNSAEGFRSEGDLKTWVAQTRLFDKPEMKPFAFALLCGFGAPLMKFTGFDGALVSLVGSSGAGKTLMLRMMLSMYGNHSELMMMHKDTQNALISRLGVYGTLPLGIDEVTNIEGKDLSDLAYRITQGRDKARLTKNSEEKKNLNGWNTLAVVSSNASLVDRLNSLKHDASAEINRIIEYPVPYVEGFSGEVTTELYWTIHKNFGHVGEEYVKWLVQNVDKLKPGIESVRKKIDEAAGIRSEERFWSAVSAAAIYGGAVAKKLGLIEFDVASFIPWVAEMIINLRGQKEELSDTSVGILGQFLDEYASNRLMIRGECTASSQDIPVELPRGPLVIRHEVDNKKMFISRAVFKTWLAKRFGEYSKVANELKDCRALRGSNVRKMLGAGTTLGGAQVPCWVIDLTAPALGAVGLQLVRDADTMTEIQDMEEAR